MKHKVIDNFLDKEYFDSLVNLFSYKKDNTPNNDMQWYFQSDPDNQKELLEHTHHIQSEDNPFSFYLKHMLYIDHQIISLHYNNLIPLLEKLEVRALIRIKANLFPNTKIVEEYAMHLDYPFSHSGAVLSLNTCDGYTKLKDGTKIDSIANRILLFDTGKEMHCATTTSNDYARFNILVNYM